MVQRVVVGPIRTREAVGKMTLRGAAVGKMTLRDESIGGMTLRDESIGGMTLRDESVGGMTLRREPIVCRRLWASPIIVSDIPPLLTGHDLSLIENGPRPQENGLGSLTAPLHPTLAHFPLPFQSRLHRLADRSVSRRLGRDVHPVPAVRWIAPPLQTPSGHLLRLDRERCTRRAPGNLESVLIRRSRT